MTTSPLLQEFVKRTAMFRRVLVAIMKEGGLYNKVMSSGSRFERAQEFMRRLESQNLPFVAPPAGVPCPFALPMFPGLTNKPFWSAADFASDMLQSRSLLESAHAELSEEAAQEAARFLASNYGEFTQGGEGPWLQGPVTAA